MSERRRLSALASQHPARPPRSRCLRSIRSCPCAMRSSDVSRPRLTFKDTSSAFWARQHGRRVSKLAGTTHGARPPTLCGGAFPLLCLVRSMLTVVCAYSPSSVHPSTFSPRSSYHPTPLTSPSLPSSQQATRSSRTQSYLTAPTGSRTHASSVRTRSLDSRHRRSASISAPPSSSRRASSSASLSRGSHASSRHASVSSGSACAVSSLGPRSKAQARTHRRSLSLSFLELGSPDFGLLATVDERKSSSTDQAYNPGDGVARYAAQSKIPGSTSSTPGNPLDAGILNPSAGGTSHLHPRLGAPVPSGSGSVNLSAPISSASRDHLSSQSTTASYRTALQHSTQTTHTDGITDCASVHPGSPPCPHPPSALVGLGSVSRSSALSGTGTGDRSAPSGNDSRSSSGTSLAGRLDTHSASLPRHTQFGSRSCDNLVSSSGSGSTVFISASGDTADSRTSATSQRLGSTVSASSRHTGNSDATSTGTGHPNAGQVQHGDTRAISTTVSGHGSGFESGSGAMVSPTSDAYSTPLYYSPAWIRSSVASSTDIEENKNNEQRSESDDRQEDDSNKDQQDALPSVLETVMCYSWYSPGACSSYVLSSALDATPTLAKPDNTSRPIATLPDRRSTLSIASSTSIRACLTLSVAAANSMASDMRVVVDDNTSPPAHVAGGVSGGVAASPAPEAYPTSSPTAMKTPRGRRSVSQAGMSPSPDTSIASAGSAVSSGRRRSLGEDGPITYLSPTKSSAANVRGVFVPGGSLAMAPCGY